MFILFKNESLIGEQHFFRNFYRTIKRQKIEMLLKQNETLEPYQLIDYNRIPVSTS